VSYLEPCWAILSDLGGHLGLSEALLELSWAILGALPTRGPPRPDPGEGVGGGVNPSPKGKKGLGKGMGHLGAILRPQEPIESEKQRRHTTLISLGC